MVLASTCQTDPFPVLSCHQWMCYWHEWTLKLTSWSVPFSLADTKQILMAVDTHRWGSFYFRLCLRVFRGWGSGWRPEGVWLRNFCFSSQPYPFLSKKEFNESSYRKKCCQSFCPRIMLSDRFLWRPHPTPLSSETQGQIGARRGNWEGRRELFFPFSPPPHPLPSFLLSPQFPVRPTIRPTHVPSFVSRHRPLVTPQRCLIAVQCKLCPLRSDMALATDTNRTSRHRAQRSLVIRLLCYVNPIYWLTWRTHEYKKEPQNNNNTSKARAVICQCTRKQ